MVISSPVCAGALPAFALGFASMSATAHPAGGENSGRDLLEEVVVTAEKRENRLQEVPVPVAVLGSDSLLDQNHLRVQEYFASVPGLQLQFNNNRSSLAIRGITSGATAGNPVVAYSVNDVPYGSSMSISGVFGSAPDLDPSELVRIEVLRGPQGTLYGASSIGGLVKYVTLEPETDQLSGAMAVGLESIHHGDGLGRSARGAVNIPLGETLATRVSVFTRESAGYIDNATTGVRGVNELQTEGGRFSALWRPSDALSIRLGAMLQATQSFGAPDIDARLGGLRQSNTFTTGFSEWKPSIYSAVVNGKVGTAEITSVSSYGHVTGTDSLDLTAGGLTAPLPTALIRKYDTDKLSQELRFTTALGEQADWLLGGFYSRERSNYFIRVFAVDPATRTAAESLRNRIDDVLTFTEYAAFTDLTLKLSDRFDVQFGARASRNKEVTSSKLTAGAPDREDEGDSVTYLFTPRLRFSPEHMIYARLATGYRPGGVNARCVESPTVIPCGYSPDETINYEIGAKGDVLGRTLTYDLSLYYIDWKDLQLARFDAARGFVYNINASRAKSQGIELSVQSTPFNGSTVSVWGAYTDAKLSEAFPAGVTTFGLAGDRLPYSSRFSGRLSVDQEIPITASLAGFAGVSVSYVGERLGEFVRAAAQVGLRQRYPAYTQTDLRFGARYDTWKLNAFVQNVTDERGAIGGGFGNNTNRNLNFFNYTQPRTVGLSLEKTF